MKLVKVGAATLNQTPRDWKGNVANIVEAINQAKKAGVSILCLPEACITGYGLEDDLFCGDVADRAMKKLMSLSLHTSGIIVSIGLPVRFNNSLYNAVATVANGAILGFTCKQHLAGDGIHYEPRQYKPWPSGVVQTIEIQSLNTGLLSVPIGDIHFNIGGIKIGYEICEDAWVAGRPGNVLATKGVDVYLNPSASHFAFGKINTRKNFVVDGSRAFGATYIYSNLVGNESGRVIFDGGCLIASGGNLLAQGKRFTYQNVLLTTAVVDIDNTKTSQVRTASFQPNVKEYNEGCVFSDFNYPKFPAESESVPLESWETSEDVKHEECTRAIGLGLMDYMRKSKTKGFAISLSGGADSAMVTYLCTAGIRLAIAELGAVTFGKKYCPWIVQHDENSEVESTDWYIHNLITTAYQPTAQSGTVTRNAAEKVADALGVPHFIFDVQPMYDEYKKVGQLVASKELNFENYGLVLQNLQARVRSPSIWIVANMENKLLLTTSNMSEAAVGYATMDGDTSGCVAPIAGLPKVYIREYLKWLETTGPETLGNVPEMALINNQQPTAELLPSSYNQTDEKDLMPYWLLHKIEGYVVKNRYVPVEVFHAIRREYPTYNINLLIDQITKFFRLFSINQWKRERYALSFHMDDHNLDPRAWCRTPILTGGYEDELDELNACRI